MYRFSYEMYRVDWNSPKDGLAKHLSVNRRRRGENKSSVKIIKKGLTILWLKAQIVHLPSPSLLKLFLLQGPFLINPWEPRYRLSGEIVWKKNNFHHPVFLLLFLKWIWVWIIFVSINEWQGRAVVIGEKSKPNMAIASFLSYSDKSSAKSIFE